MKAYNKYMSTVKLGPKGQIVIPKEVRVMFGLEPGSSLVLMADPERGIALNTTSFYSMIADKMFDAASKPHDNAQIDKDRIFAENIKHCIEEDKD